MKVTIKIEYQTGDSFHTEEAEGTVELEWENVEVAKTAMQRIKEHYEWFNYKNNCYPWRDKIERPKWHKTNLEDDKFSLQYVINLPLDGGGEQQISAFWCGHFEVLHAAEIVPVKPEFQGMRVTF